MRATPMLPSLPFVCAAAVLAVPLVRAAADPQPSPSWRKPNITASRADRITLAQAAIDEAVSQLDSTISMFADPSDTYGTSGAFYSQLAEFDLASNQTRYEGNLQGYLASARATLDSQFGATNFTGINDGLNFGHAAAIAYLTYNSSVFLQYAIQSWWAAMPYTLTQAQADAGNTSVKDFNVTKSCQGITMAGGTFWTKDPDIPAIVGLGTGGFLVLSALLAEATSDPMYLQAAILSADFIHAHLYNVENVVQDLISGRANDSCAITSVSVLESYNSGLMIEGLSILYAISQNASLVDLVDNIVIASISSTGWQGDDGVIANGATKSGDSMLPRGLATAYTRNATSPGLRSYIASYLGVQYNAVFDLARNNGSTNVYGASWVGPPSPSNFSGSAQANAIQALISTIALDGPSLAVSNPNGTSSLAGSSPSGTGTSVPGPASSSASPSPHHKSAVGAIAGGTIGGLLLLLGTGVGVFLWRRRQGVDGPAPGSRRTLMGMAPASTAATNPFSDYSAPSPLGSDPAGSMSGPPSASLPDTRTSNGGSESLPGTPAALLPNRGPWSRNAGAGAGPSTSLTDFSSATASYRPSGARAPSPSPSSESWAAPPPTLSDSPLGSAASGSAAGSGPRAGTSSGKLRQMAQAQALAAPAPPGASPDAVAIPTQELVRLLYQRIHSGDADAAGADREDRPPDYRATPSS